MNQEILDKITNQDYSVIKGRIQKKIQEKIIEIGSKGVIFGLSGGIDSAVIAYLSKGIETSNPGIYQATAIIMPDSKISPEDETNDALKIVDSLNLNYKFSNFVNY